MSRSVLFFAFLAVTGCESSPELFAPSSLVDREDLWGSFLHRVEVVEAEPPLTPGATTAPVQVIFSESEDFLYVVDLDGEPHTLRAVFPIDRRYAVDADGRLRLGEDETPNALRIGPQDRRGAFGSELGLGRIEPLPYFLPEDDARYWLPSIERDEDTGAIVRLELPSAYFDHDAGAAFMVVHRFERVSE